MNNSLRCIPCMIKPTGYCRVCKVHVCSIHEIKHGFHCTESKDMGCDIHAYIEYTNSDGYVRCFAPVHIGRDYTLFGYLAGVRGNPPGALKPKGIPDKLSFWAEDAYCLHVNNANAAKDYSGWVTRESADDWVKKGYSVYIGEDKTRVSSSDWHSSSWTTTKELEKIYKRHKTNMLVAIIATMKALDKAGNKSRLTFWFDN